MDNLQTTLSCHSALSEAEMRKVCSREVSCMLPNPASQNRVRTYNNIKNSILTLFV